MLTEPTIEKLTTMGLGGMAAALAEQQTKADVAGLPFDERLGLLVDAEWYRRQNRRLERALKEARLKIGQATIEGIDYPPKRQLDKALIRSLATCRWVEERQNVIVTGSTGVGKTYIACALAHQACRKGYRAFYRRASRLFDELALARADGSYARVLTKIARVDVLILDDWGLVQVREPERRDLYEILDDRSTTRSTIITSQLPVDNWHDHIGDPTIADSICDRLVHNAHRVVLRGPSRRKEDNSTKS